MWKYRWPTRDFLPQVGCVTPQPPFWGTWPKKCVSQLVVEFVPWRKIRTSRPLKMVNTWSGKVHSFLQPQFIELQLLRDVLIEPTCQWGVEFFEFFLGTNSALCVRKARGWRKGLSARRHNIHFIYMFPNKIHVMKYVYWIVLFLP